MNKNIQNEKKSLKILRGKIATLTLLLTLSGTASLTGCGKEKKDNKISVSTEIVNTIEQSEEITTENVVLEDRIDQIIDEYNNLSKSNLTRENLGIFDYDYKQCMHLYKNTSNESITKYVYDNTLGYNVPENYEYIDPENISKMYVLVDKNTNSAIASLAIIKEDINSDKKIENVYVRCYRYNSDNIYAESDRYLLLNTDDFDGLKEYLDERVEYLETQKSLKLN